MQKVRNPQYCIVNITSMFAFWSVGAWLNLLHAWRVRSRLYACERVGSSRKTVVPFPGFSVMQIRISMLQSFRFGPWEPGNEVKYTARLARTIDVDCVYMRVSNAECMRLASESRFCFERTSLQSDCNHTNVLFLLWITDFLQSDNRRA